MKTYKVIISNLLTGSMRTDSTHKTARDARSHAAELINQIDARYWRVTVK